MRRASSAFYAPPPPRLEALIWAALALGCLILLTLFVSNVRDALSSRAWPSVRARIDEAHVFRGCIGMPRFSTSYHPRLRYSYSVAGQVYQGDRISAGTAYMCGSQAEVQHFVARNYPVGRTVTAFYDPNDPSNSLLKPGVFDPVSIIMAGVLVVGAGYTAHRSHASWRAAKYKRLNSSR